MKKLFTFFIISCTCFTFSNAQKIDNLVSFRDIDNTSYFRFNYENDYFANGDENYTQGYNFELFLKSLKKNPINFLFFKPNNSTKKYGLSLEHIGFTPDDYVSENIQFGDRPFASAIMLKSMIITINTTKKIRLISSFNLGIIGPAAFGEDMQVGIHKWTGNKIPKGWKNQIKNDIVVNYEIGLEKQIVTVAPVFSLQAQSKIKAGTLFTNASFGLSATFGIIDKPFSIKNSAKKFNFYGFLQSIGTAVVYDATLQSGMFNNSSTYTISSGEVKRLTGQYAYGFILKTRTLFFEYSRYFITKEFNSGSSAKWGGIKIGFTF
ncbi:lipid A deacylase LpxR family protein [Lacinutrix sp. 5H-3-7-4]|uniref:lipid A deacylase LpxR family protein n=1 Tax=Lacinutrix sp. (strain 5H-3-7-4) TaxID=983544 RepID=UPI00020A375A|nr:lipid A deacylase LpxR family protein [Lacinutrix sp. 5H-3-7-4]AEH02192.1 Protein of unknown function DUF2219 [Lacinutrix sp. 5H-3-7-4]